MATRLRLAPQARVDLKTIGRMQEYSGPRRPISFCCTPPRGRPASISTKYQRRHLHGLDRTGPELREVLTLQGEAVACPSLVRAIRQRQHDRHQPAEIRTLFGICSRANR